MLFLKNWLYFIDIPLSVSKQLRISLNLHSYFLVFRLKPYEQLAAIFPTEITMQYNRWPFLLVENAFGDDHLLITSVVISHLLKIRRLSQCECVSAILHFEKLTQIVNVFSVFKSIHLGLRQSSSADFVHCHGVIIINRWEDGALEKPAWFLVGVKSLNLATKLLI